MSKHCDIMSRIKNNLEQRNRTYLLRRMPVILRIDGKKFSQYSKNLIKPFDEGLMEDMIETTKYLCANIQGAKCGYTQSDEISILITDYNTLQTDAWFDYEVQKMTSIGASLATGIFNQLRLKRKLVKISSLVTVEEFGNCLVLERGDLDYTKIANFDARVFNCPKEEVANVFLARQKDAVKNSISMLGQSFYSHTELHKKNSNEVQEMCFQKGHNWNDLSYNKKRGSFIIKETFTKEDGTIRSKWNSVETPLTFTHSVFEKWL